MEKMYGGLVVKAVDEALLPKVGDKVVVEEVNSKTLGTNLGNNVILTMAKESDKSLINQIKDFSLTTEEEMVKVVLSKSVSGRVVSTQEIFLDKEQSKKATMLIVEMEKPEIKKESVIPGTINITLTGIRSKFPEMKTIYDDAAKGTVNGKLVVKKTGNAVTLFYNDKPVSETTDRNVISRFNFVDDKEITASFKEARLGRIVVEVNEKDFEIKLDEAFDKEVEEAIKRGLERQDIEDRISAGIHYGIPVTIMKQIVNNMKIYDDEGETLIPQINKVKSGNKYLYIDKERVILREASYTFDNSNPLSIRLAGDASVGKNMSLNTLAYIFRKPLIVFSCSDGTSEDQLIGSDTLKDGCVTFEVSALVNAAKKGYWYVLDEINSVHPSVLISLHPLMDRNERTLFIEKVGKIEADENFRLFATMNPPSLNSSYEGTKMMNDATQRRFDKTIRMKNSPSIKEILEAHCPEASKEQIQKVVNLYNSIKLLTEDPVQGLPEVFCSISAYESALMMTPGISLKESCIDSISNLDMSEPSYEESILNIIDDIFGRD